MKAIEYYAKYSPRILNPERAEDEINKALFALVLDLSVEVGEIMNTRRVKKEDAIMAVIQEQNNKWNAISAIFQKNLDGATPMLENGFLNFWILKLKGRSDEAKS